MKRSALSPAVVALTLSLAGCGEAPEPVATLQVEPQQIELAYPAYEHFRLRWEVRDALAGLEGQPLVFIHLLDAGGNVVRTYDHPFKLDWRPGAKGEYEIELYQSGLAPPLAAGDYDLSVGLYDLAGHRWPLDTAGEEVDRFEYRVARVAATAEAADVPMFYFSPAWQGLETGTDRQVLARRWLTGPGSIRVAEADAAGSIWMLLRIPGLESDAEELVLDPGADEPMIRVRSDCSGTEASIAGFGTHEVTVPVEPQAAEATEAMEATEGKEGTEEGGGSGDCEITFEPNFHILLLDTLGRRAAALEGLAWSGGG